ncbi:unnamed protein product [Pieris brassicae]|uniref:Uncharacterized protein n=1 Tax=Pieris brassicae TaxID=7116 RepID=A0A9P0X811_PIEBR|nr:unnamed protein product [Pieris brassicae]
MYEFDSALTALTQNVEIAVVSARRIACRWRIAAASAASLPQCRVIRASHATEVDSGHGPASASIIQHASTNGAATSEGQRQRTATPTGPPPARHAPAPYEIKPEATKAKTKHTYHSKPYPFATPSLDSARQSRVT